MIDYEKLIMVGELAYKFKIPKLIIDIGIIDNTIKYEFYEPFHYSADNIDALLEKLQELTNPFTKFEEAVVNTFKFAPPFTSVDDVKKTARILEKEMRKIGMLKEECQHESDGMNYLSKPPCKKCIKCGELYI
jgi:hypothetical protein